MMRVQRRTIVIAVLTAVLFAVLPLTSLAFIPAELLRYFTIQAGVDLKDLLYKIAAFGLATSVLALAKGSVEKNSGAGLALVVTSKILWLLIVLFALGLGRIENLGIAVLSSRGGGATNVVAFDLRLFAALAAAITALSVLYSLLEFHDSMSERGSAASGSGSSSSLPL